MNAKAGLTFAAALRSILRCDPDIVMIGEMRDRETATIAIEAALTGHLVLSTLHTNDAPGALTRLMEMGVEPFLVVQRRSGVLAQRLARRLCEAASSRTSPRASYLVWRRLGFPAPGGEDDAPPVLYGPWAAPRCGQRATRGRMGIHEVMLDERGDRASSRCSARSAEEIRRASRRRGHASPLRRTACRRCWAATRRSKSCSGS